MTTFSINRFNHSPIHRMGLDDITFILAGMLNDLGHKVILDDHRTYQDPLVNILFEGFTAQAIDLVKRSKDENARIVLVLDALPTDKGFEGHDANFLRGQRMDGFMTVAPLADAIWCTDPGAVEWCTQMNKNSTLISLGWSQHLDDELATMSPDAEAPSADFCFFGEMTPWRRSMLLDLRKTRSVLLPKKTPNDPNYMSLADRNAMVRASRAVLCPQAFPGQQHFSQSRALMALMLGRAVGFQNDVPLPPYWSSIARISESKDTDFLLENWRALHVSQMAVLLETLPPAFCLGDALKRLGV